MQVKIHFEGGWTSGYLELVRCNLLHKGDIVTKSLTSVSNYSASSYWVSGQRNTLITIFNAEASVWNPATPGNSNHWVCVDGVTIRPDTLKLKFSNKYNPKAVWVEIDGIEVGRWIYEHNTSLHTFTWQPKQRILIRSKGQLLTFNKSWQPLP